MEDPLTTGPKTRGLRRSMARRAAKGSSGPGIPMGGRPSLDRAHAITNGLAAIGSYERTGARSILDNLNRLCAQLQQDAWEPDETLRGASDVISGYTCLLNYWIDADSNQLDASATFLSAARATVGLVHPLWDMYRLVHLLVLITVYVSDPSQVNLRKMLGFARRYESTIDDLIGQGRFISLNFLEAGLVLFAERHASTEPFSPERGQAEHLLARACRVRFEISGDRKFLDLACEHATAAVGLPATDKDRAGQYFTLAAVRAMAYDVGGDYADLVVAVQSAEASVHLTDAEAPERRKRLCELGIVLRMRHMRSDDIEDLGLALHAYKEASELNNMARAPSVELGLAELWLTFAGAGGGDRLTSLINAEKSSRLALEMAEQHAAIYVDRAKSVLAHALFESSSMEVSENSPELSVEGRGALDEAISHLEDLVPLDSSSRGIHTFNLLQRLLSAYAFRFSCLQRSRDRSRFLAALKRLFSFPDTTAFQRCTVWKMVAEAAVRAKDWDHAASFFNNAIMELGDAASQLNARLDQEYLFTNLATLASDAAYACCMNDEPKRGLAQYAAARGVLLRAKRFRDQWMDDLRNVDSEAVTEFETLLNLANQQQRVTQLELGAAEVQGVTHTHLVAAMKKLERIADENGLVSSVTEFAPFGGEDVDLDLGEAGSPLVVISVGTVGSCVFVLANDQLNGLSTEITRGTITDTVASFVSAADSVISSSASSEGFNSLMDTLLDLIGEHLVQPALDLIRSCGVAVEDATIRWCLSGHLQMLPWSAIPIGEMADGQPRRLVDVAATAILSHLPYTGHGRGALSAFDVTQALLVAMPYTHGQASLSQAVGEVQDVQGVVGTPDSRLGIRIGPDATRARVLSALPEARLIHLACHASASPRNPAMSRILLWDHETDPLTLGDIAAVRTVPGGLAYLSGCSTGRAVGALVEEPLNLASAFELAGFDYVVGTLWPVRDHDSRLAANSFYASLLSLQDQGESQDLRPAEALRAATLRLREAHPHDLVRWASHFVLGG